MRSLTLSTRAMLMLETSHKCGGDAIPGNSASGAEAADVSRRWAFQSFTHLPRGSANDGQHSAPVRSVLLPLGLCARRPRCTVTEEVMAC